MDLRSHPVSLPKISERKKTSKNEFIVQMSIYKIGRIHVSPIHVVLEFVSLSRN